MKRLYAFLLLLNLFWLSLPALADVESWQAVDVRIPIQNNDQIWIPRRLNVFTIAQLAPRFESGLGILRYSVGPQWEFNPHFSLGLLGDIIYVGVPGGKNTQEYRLNIEPVFRGRFLPELSWIDRTRLEYRSFPDRSNWRVRNLLRLNWSGWSQEWIPYLANEVFLEYPQGFNQNRSFLGVRHVMDRANQLDIGYMWRSRKSATGNWEHDHILMLFLFFAPPDQAHNLLGGE